MTEPGGIAVESHDGDTTNGTRATEREVAVNARPTAYFLFALTLGSNVHFARLATDVAQRKRWGPFNNAASVLEALAHLQPVPVTLRFSGVRNGNGQQTAEERVVTLQALQIAVVNTPVFGER